MRKIVLVIFVFFSFVAARAQSEALSARALSLGYAGGGEVSAFSAFYNQANLARLDQGLNAGLFYQNYWALPGYDLKDIAVAYTFERQRTIAVDFMSVGITGYNEQKIGLAYGMRLWENFYAGLQLNFHILNQPSYYGDIYAGSAEVSLTYVPAKDLHISARVFNPFYGILGSQNIPVIFDLSVDYRFGPKAYFIAQLTKDITQPLEYKWGAEYRIIEDLGIRAGGRLQGGIYAYTLGLSYDYKFFGLDLGFSSQPYLGTVGGMSIRFQAFKP